MSGGSFDYIHCLDGNELLTKHGVVENVEAMVKQLNSYGEQGQLAAARTQAFQVKLEMCRAIMAQMEQELSQHAGDLTRVWRQADLHASYDAGADSVLEVLAEHDASENPVAMAVELALADAVDDVTTPLEETGKRWQFIPELSPTPERRAARMALHEKMTAQERDDAVNQFHRGLEPITHFASGRPVDNSFLLSIL